MDKTSENITAELKEAIKNNEIKNVEEILSQYERKLINRDVIFSVLDEDNKVNLVALELLLKYGCYTMEDNKINIEFVRLFIDDFYGKNSYNDKMYKKAIKMLLDYKAIHISSITPPLIGRNLTELLKGGINYINNPSTFTWFKITSLDIIKLIKISFQDQIIKNH